MHRFHYPQSLALFTPSSLLELDADQSRHARRSLRLSPGDTAEIFDGQGRWASATLLEYHRDNAHWQIQQIHFATPLTPHLTLAVAPPKGARIDEMVNQLSQLGVDHLLLLTTERSIASPSEHRLDRLRRIVIESAKQCHRPYLMQMTGPIPFAQALLQPADLRLLAWPGAQPLSSSELVSTLTHSHPSNVILYIGPEGDWSAAEVAAAQAASCRPWLIGPYVLRVETAAATAASIIRYFTPVSSVSLT